MILDWTTPGLTHRCHLKVARTILAWRVTHAPVRIAIKQDVYKCACGRVFSADGAHWIRGKA